MIRTLTFVLAFALVARAEDGPIDALEVNGLERTERFVVERELPWKPGEEITPEAWALGLARLWNTGLFAAIAPRVEEAGGRRRAVFDVEERFTLNPLFRLQFVGATGLVRVGASDINVLGRFLEIGAQYERFGSYNGGQAWVRQPRLFDRRVQGLLLVERLTRPRPGFAVVRTLARVETIAEKHDHLAFSGRLDLLADRIERVDEPHAGLPGDSAGLVGSVAVRIGRVDTVRVRQRSWQLELRPGAGLTSDAANPRWVQATAELLAFAIAGERWNFALRLQAGAMGSAPLQHRFFLGGLDLVRGLLDNELRTRRYAFANAEARVVAFDSTWLAIMPVAFADAVVARTEPDLSTSALASVGLGVRFLVPKMLNVGGRADLAFASNGRLALPSIGVYQFF